MIGWLAASSHPLNWLLRGVGRERTTPKRKFWQKGKNKSLTKKQQKVKSMTNGGKGGQDIHPSPRTEALLSFWFVGGSKVHSFVLASEYVSVKQQIFGMYCNV